MPRFILRVVSEKISAEKLDWNLLLKPVQSQIQVLDTTAKMALVEAEESILKEFVDKDSRLTFSPETHHPLPDSRRKIDYGLGFNYEEEQKATEEAAADVIRYLTTYPKSTRLNLAQRLRERASIVETAFRGDRAMEKILESCSPDKV